MRTVVLFLALLGATCLGASPGVDGLSRDDVTKAVSALKEKFVRPDALSDDEIARATLQGLLDRLAPAVSLATGTSGAEAASPFYSEVCEGKTGYLRPGQWTRANLDKAREALKDWTGKGLGAVVLDLRGTPASSDFDIGTGLAGFFCAKGTEVFSLSTKGGELKTGPASTETQGNAITPSLTPGETRAFRTGGNPVFKGILVVLVDGETAEAPEAVAASLQKCAKALLVGDKTAGRAFQFSDVPLNGALLRVAVAQVVLPDGKEPGESGLTPDISVGLGKASKKEVMRSITAKRVASVIEEHDRAHLNEAALVSGSNPEVDQLQAEQAGHKPAEPLIDRQLQRALDLVTSISIYQAKGEAGPKTGE